MRQGCPPTLSCSGRPTPSMGQLRTPYSWAGQGCSAIYNWTTGSDRTLWTSHIEGPKVRNRVPCDPGRRAQWLSTRPAMIDMLMRSLRSHDCTHRRELSHSPKWSDNRILQQYTQTGLSMGISDLKSAFKTLPASTEQAWLSWRLVYNPSLGRHQVAPLLSQSFGSLGAVMSWYRTVMLLQCILQNLFHITTMVYVDDCFWACPGNVHDGGPNAAWQSCVFQYVVEELLGWRLDPEKTEFGKQVTLLGLRITLNEESAEWTLSPDKASAWADDIQGFLDSDMLAPSDASKLCGRLAFLNSKIFGKMGRALLRPLIWRQLQSIGPLTLTRRLRNSLTWFLLALRANWVRTVPYVMLTPASRAVIYSDAESTGHIGVVVLFQGRIWFGHGDIPRRIRNMLKTRKTNIMGYELVAAILVIIMLDKVIPQQACIQHYIDNQSAKHSVIAGFSRQPDMNELVGMLWHTAAHRSHTYWAEWVQSEANIADAPSRHDCRLLKRIGGCELELDFSLFTMAAEKWRQDVKKCRLVPLRRP